MRLPPVSVPTRRPLGWRWLLVVLTVLASHAHLTRSAQVGGLGLIGGGLSLGRVHTAHAALDVQEGGGAPPVTWRGEEAPAHTHPPQFAEPGTPHLTDAAPNAPPADEHHAGLHCPFCLTGAFALAAQGDRAVLLRAPELPRPARAVLAPACAAGRHADARAPPPLQV